jgi:hypothetical protein
MKYAACTRTCWLWVSLFAWACFGAACESSSEAPAGIVVAVYTDLEVGDTLASLTASVLDDGGNETRSQHTFSFQPRASVESNFLVSFGVERGKSARLRLLLQGYAASDTQRVTPVITQVLQVPFERKGGLLRAFLGTSCVIEPPCAPELSCNPVSRACEAPADSRLEPRGRPGSEELSWQPEGYVPLSSAMSAPDAGLSPWDGRDGGDAGVDPGVDTGVDPCGAEDGSCPEGCAAEADRDCARFKGASCSAATDCESQHCVLGVCCETECSSANLYPSCREGSCQSGVCMDGFADCNLDKASDGCETELARDADHCGVCGRRCPYGVCRNAQCVSSKSGSDFTGGATWYEKGRVFGFRIRNREQGRLASIGLWVAQPNNAMIYFSLYLDGNEEDATEDVPQLPRLARSPALTIGSDSEFVEWILPRDPPRPVLYGGEKGYWVFFTVSEDTLLYADPIQQAVWTSTGTPEFGPIDEYRDLDEFGDEGEFGLPFPSLFLTVIPDPISAL